MKKQSETNSKMMNFTVHQLMVSVEDWLTTGKLQQETLHNDFIFTSPFWKQADRQAFVDQFFDPTQYKQAALSKIIKFDPVIACVSEDHHHFTIALTYHTQNGHSVDEVVVCEVLSGQLFKMTSVYDLHETKVALELG